MDLLRPLHLSSSSGIIAHGILRNSVIMEFLRTRCARNIFPHKARRNIAVHGNQKLHDWSFCAGDPQKLCYWSFCAPGVPKTSFPIRHGGISLLMGTSKTPLLGFLHLGSSESPLLEFLRTRCTKNLVSYKAQWNITAHGNVKNSTNGVSAQGILRNSVIGVSVHLVRQKLVFL